MSLLTSSQLTFCDIADGIDGISYEIESSNGYVFNSDDSEIITLTARIYKGAEEIDPDGNYSYFWYGMDDDENQYDIISQGKSISIDLAQFTNVMHIYFVCDTDSAVLLLSDENNIVLTDESDIAFDVSGLSISSQSLDMTAIQTKKITDLPSSSSVSSKDNIFINKNNIPKQVNIEVLKQYVIDSMNITPESIGAAAISHTTTDGSNGEASTSVYGHTKLSSSVTSTSTSLAATPKAVKTAYDLANGKADAQHNHDGMYLPMSGGTLTGDLQLSDGKDIIFSVSSAASGDTGNIVFQNSDGVEIGRIWESSTADYFCVKFGSSDTAQKILTSTNYSSYALPLAGGALTGSLYANAGIQVGQASALDQSINMMAGNDGTFYRMHGNANQWWLHAYPQGNVGTALLTADTNWLWTNTPEGTANDDRIATTKFVNTAVGNYLPKSGGTLTGNLTLGDGKNLNLKAGSSSTADAGDIVFQNSSGTEIGRIWESSTADYFCVRFSSSDTAQKILTSTNYSSYALPKSGGTLTGNLCFSNTDVEQNIQFNDGGSTSWNTGFYKGNKDAGTVLGMYDWTNSRRVWGYNTAGNFMVDMPLYAPTATTGTSSTQVATTAFVHNTLVPSWGSKSWYTSAVSDCGTYIRYVDGIVFFNVKLITNFAIVNADIGNGITPKPSANAQIVVVDSTATNAGGGGAVSVGYISTNGVVHLSGSYPTGHTLWLFGTYVV